MSREGSPIPSYRKPPIIEAVWSLQFADMEWLLPPHTGLFWNRIRERFPRCEEQPPIAHMVETPSVIGGPLAQAAFYSVPPLSRQLFVSDSGNELIQLQRDRVCCNWRRIKSDDVYPRYERMREVFEYTWEAFCAFVKELGHPLPAVDQCEMTYINHIDQGKEWTTIGQIEDVFPAVRWGGSSAFLPPPRTLGARFTFDIPELNGRLHASLRHGLRKENGAGDRELLLLELTARGLPPQTDEPSLLAWYGIARDCVVRGFTDLTTPAMHKLWERER